ncbi:MAG: GTP pyrophosphokinase [Bacteroidetes bacterium]|nr:MAG: GTP pyrophosphokinase [Bacteroidota bacterium]
MIDKITNIKIEGEKQVQDALIEVLDLCPRCRTKEQRTLIINAYHFAYEAHKGLKRKTGEPFIMHPIEVAKIVLTEIRLGVTSVMCALLHDVVEDNEEISLEDVENKFGKQVASIIDGLTKITNIYDDEQNVQAETFRKMLMSIPQDIRVILIKLADRLHNMRTLDGMEENRQIVKAGETLYVYAPLARRLGLNKIGRELEDLSFKHHLPDDYKKLLQIIKSSEEKREKNFNNFQDRMRPILKRSGIKYEIIGIRKSLYATWIKMRERQIPFDEIHNFQTMRLIFDPKIRDSERMQCYRIFALITEEFTAKKGSLQDLVKNPKANGFEALIVDIMDYEGNWKEVQILSRRMADIAERGYSSEKGDKEEKLSEREKWIQSIGDQLINPESNALDFLDNFKLNIYTSEIYVFTPLGKIVKLPKGSTVLDFAFHIHTQLGFHCIGAKVNKKLVNRSHVLNSADQIEVLDSVSTLPDKSWMNQVVSARAKTSLKNSLKKQIKDNVQQGEIILKEVQSTLDFETDQASINKLVKYFHSKDKRELYNKIGKGLIGTEELTKGFRTVNSTSLFENLIPSIFKSKSSDNNHSINQEFSHKKPFLIEESVEDTSYSFSECCHPIPGDKSIAYKNPNGYITIHQISCPNAIKLNAEHGKSVAKVQWGSHLLTQHLSSIHLKGIDRKKIVHELTEVISTQMNVNMKSIHIDSSNGIYNGNITIYVSSLNALNSLISKLKKISGIKTVERIKN